MRNKYLFSFILLALGLFLVVAGGVTRIMHVDSSIYFFWSGLASLLLSVILFVIIKIKEE